MANVATKSGMTDQTSSNIARDGAAKKPQTSFPVKDGMKDMTTMSGIAPSNPGTGPDASSPNPLDPEPRAKLLKKQGSELQAAWDQKDGDGDGLDNAIGGQVMDEAQLKARL
jgi:hypothetical protein